MRMIVHLVVPLPLFPPEALRHTALQHELREDVVRERENEQHGGDLPLEALGVAVVRPDAAELRDLLALQGRGAVARRGQATLLLVGQPKVRAPAVLGHLALPHLDLRAQKATANAASREGRERRQLPRVEGLLHVAVHPVDAIELRRGGEQQPREAEEEDHVNDVDSVIKGDIAAERSAVGVDVSRIYKAQDQHQHTKRGVIGVAPEHPQRREQVNVCDRVQLHIPLGPPKKRLADHQCDDRGHVGEGDGGDRARAEQCRSGPVVAEVFGGPGLGHRPHHDHANAYVHREPHEFAQAHGRVDQEDRSDRGQHEGIHDEVLEGGHVCGEACPPLADQVDDRHQRLAVAPRGERRDHRGFGVGEGQAGVRGAQAAAIVAAVPAHAGDEGPALEILHDIDLVLWLHAGEYDQPVPDLLQLARVPVQVSPCALGDGQLALFELGAIQVLGLRGVGVRIPPLDRPGGPQVAEQHARIFGQDAALPSNGDARQGVVARADHGADRPPPQLLDRLPRVLLDLVPEQQQPAHGQAGLQAVPGQVGDLLLREAGGEGLRRDAKDVVTLLRVGLRLRHVVQWHGSGIADALHLLIAPFHKDLGIVGPRAAHNDAAGHSTMVEIQLLDDVQLLVARGRSEYITLHRPAHGADHGHLDLVPDEGAVFQRCDSVAAGQGVTQPFRYLACHCGTVRGFGDLRVVGMEMDFVGEGSVFHADHRIEIHAVLGDRPRLVKHHCRDLPRDRNAPGLQAMDLVRVLQARGGHRLPHDHADRQHRAQAHGDGVDDHQVHRDPRMELHKRRHVDRAEQHHIDADNAVDRGQLVGVLEADARREEHHPDQLPAGRQGADCCGDHDGPAVVRPSGLHAHRSCVRLVLLRDARALRILHGHLLDRHGLSCQHGLVHDQATLDDDAVAGQRRRAAIDGDDVAQDDVAGLSDRPLPVAQHLALGVQLGELMDFFLVRPDDEERAEHARADGHQQPEDADIPRGVDHV
mmetsp:Transcript_43090/g.125386  ORF Transcript_43090/g.125386 Transcript_43090/m.125386 type:complete len:982 (+) Transcript_43090:301-3246(+)